MWIVGVGTLAHATDKWIGQMLVVYRVGKYFENMVTNLYESYNNHC